jgi:polysaccharide export outer membrane protein
MMKSFAKLLGLFLLVSMLAYIPTSHAAANDYQLGAGDAVRISVFQNPDLTLETRVSESGTITYPLIGEVKVIGMSPREAEQLIAQKLIDGNFVKRPQVNITLVEVRGSQVAVIGLVNKPGRFPVESSNMRLSEAIAAAGGVAGTAGTGTAVVTGKREGKPIRVETDIASLFLSEGGAQDTVLRSGDIIYVMTGNQVSIQGQVNRPGRYALESSKMHVSEVLTLAGGLTQEAADIAIVAGKRNGQNFRKEIDIPALYLSESNDQNVLIAAGDEVYVQKAPVYYIYGEAQKPGSYRIERNMTVIQALAQGGGPTIRGTQRNLKLMRRDTNGETVELTPKMTDLVRPDDVIYVRESLF